MVASETLIKFLVQWYQIHKRDLPWRNTGDPYKIWLSEVILQQTRVNQGLGYYQRFIEKFTSLQDLAAAEPQDVLKQWQGLGYYSRARNLHEGARQIVRDFRGVFPSEYDKILSIKGVGEYTAAAIASIAFGLPYAVLDGNVYRVVSRIFLIEDPVNSGTGKKKIRSILLEMIENEDPGTFNQALMELGALVCTPSGPSCLQCPVKDFCQAFKNNIVSRYPVPQIKKPPLQRYFHYILPLWKQDDSILTLIRQRQQGDIWAGLFEFPLIEAAQPLTMEEISSHPLFRSCFGRKKFQPLWYTDEIVHKLTHRIIHARILILNLDEIIKDTENQEYIIIQLNQQIKYPIPRLIDKFITSKVFREILQSGDFI